ncbi:MAG: LmeA family phospholipid-binding protein [Jatrophihabitantaceae bacterium]
MTALLVALIVVVALAVGLALADRLVARLAERKASEYLTAPLGRGARVRVHGRPFLSQALRGRYRQVEVTASGLQLGVMAGTTLHAHLVNAYLPLRDLLGRRADELPVENVHGDVVIAYTELARVSTVPGLGFVYRDDRLVARARLPVPGISQLARVSGEAVATIGESGGVSVRLRNISVAGFTVPGLVLSQLLPSVAFPVPLPPLPYGLRIEALTPTPDGLRVSGSAQAVVIRRTGMATPIRRANPAG